MRLQASTPVGDGGEVGRLRIGETAARARELGEKWWLGGNGFLVKSNLAVARFAKRAIAKIAIAVFAKRAAAIAM